MTFEEYLVKKRINGEVFAARDPGRYTAWQSMYAQMHPNSFYVAVKMVLNNVRLRYHLREEDMPKPVPAATQRPAARRAATHATVPAAAIPDTPAAIPATTDVPQETPEEKRVAPVAAAKPRPVVRRPAALQKPAPEKEATAEKPAEDAAPAAPRVRPVIKRTVIGKPATEAPAGGAAPTQQEPAASRPRPVIKRPAALAKPTEEPIDTQEEGQPNAAHAIPEAAKPARPRPVIKRPAALQKPTGETEKPAPAAGMVPASEAPTTEAPKPPRPRPVMKRPAALVQPSALEGKERTAPSQQASPAAPAGRPINAASAEARTDAALTERASQKEKHIPDAPAGAEPRNNAAAAEAPKEGEAEKPKPPRPRPIMRRPPPKTED